MQSTARHPARYHRAAPGARRSTPGGQPPSRLTAVNPHTTAEVHA
jgi:hypothetical protein